MGKFIVVNTVALIVLGLLAAAHLLDPILNSPALPGICVLLALVVGGLVCVATKRYAAAHWITDKMTLFGLAGTVLGVIHAFTHAVFEGDPVQVMGALATGMGLALFSTLTGIVGYVWLDWNMYLGGNSGAISFNPSPFGDSKRSKTAVNGNVPRWFRDNAVALRGVREKSAY